MERVPTHEKEDEKVTSYRDKNFFINVAASIIALPLVVLSVIFGFFLWIGFKTGLIKK